MRWVKINRYVPSDAEHATGLCEGVEYLLTDKEREELRKSPGYGDEYEKIVTESPADPARLWSGIEEAPRGATVAFYYPGGIGDACAQTAVIAAVKTARPDLKLWAFSRPVTAPVWLHNQHLEGQCARPFPILRQTMECADRWMLADSLVYHLTAKDQPGMYEAMEAHFRIKIPAKRPTLWVTKQEIESVARRGALKPKRPNVLFAPIASKITRTWPSSKWKAFVEEAETFGANIIAVGSGSDGAELHRRLAGVIEPSRILVNELSIRQLIALVYLADGLVTVDTSLGHMAGAFQKPCLSLFGPFDPAWRVTGYKGNRHIWPKGICDQAPCSWHDDGHPPACPGRAEDCCNVLQAISATQAATEMREMFAG